MLDAELSVDGKLLTLVVNIKSMNGSSGLTAGVMEDLDNVVADSTVIRDSHLHGFALRHHDLVETPPFQTEFLERLSLAC